MFIPIILTALEKHNGKVLLGLNYERYNQDNMWASGTDLTTEDKPFLEPDTK